VGSADTGGLSDRATVDRLVAQLVNDRAKRAANPNNLNILPVILFINILL
jgi:hypothetical protein